MRFLAALSALLSALVLSVLIGAAICLAVVVAYPEPKAEETSAPLVDDGTGLCEDGQRLIDEWMLLGCNDQAAKRIEAHLNRCHRCAKVFNHKPQKKLP